jgi:hypothetical protein
MKTHLVIVGPGIMEIPPSGWGAVESLIWDYKVFLDRYHSDEFTVSIVNLREDRDIVMTVDRLHPNIVHIQYDNHAHLANAFRCHNILLTSHYGYIDQMPSRTGDGYKGILDTFVNLSKQKNTKIACLSPSIAAIYKQYGCPDDKLIVQANGANDELFRFAEQPQLPNKSIYLAKIDYRKRQHVYQALDMIDFAGNCVDGRFDTRRPNYLGEWSRSHLYQNLTNYANLVLLSDGEAHPLVCCEALVCGLGLVISEFASANLDTSLPFIDVIPTDKLDDLQYVAEAVKRNQAVSVTMRSQIREYGIANFGWKSVVSKYAGLLKSMV